MTLMITVVVMIILTTTVSVSGVVVYNNYKKVKFATEIAFIDQGVNNYYKFNSEYPVSDTVIVDISKLSSNAIEQFKDENIANNKITLYKLDKQLIGKNETIYGNEKTPEDIYAISDVTGRIYYIKGIKSSNTTYYTLTEDLKKIINIDEIKKVESVDNITFEKKYSGYVNTQEQVTIKIPEIYQNVSVSVYSDGILKNSGITKSSNDGKGFDIYITEPILQNSDVVVLYTKNEEQKKQIFSVDNIDTVAPTFDVSVPTKIVDDLGNTYYLVELSNIKDDISGIKSIKYETEKIFSEQINSYFSNNGKNLSKDTYVIKDEVTSGYITVYISDIAGNIAYKYIEVK